MTQTWSTASSSMCWVSSINSSTSRNMSFRLTGPRSRASRRITASVRAAPPVAHNKHKLKDTDSSMIPDIFPSLPPPSRCCLSVYRAAEQCDARRAHSRTQLDPFYLESLRSGGGGGEINWNESGLMAWKRFKLHFMKYMSKSNCWLW